MCYNADVAENYVYAREGIYQENLLSTLFIILVGTHYIIIIIVHGIELFQNIIFKSTPLEYESGPGRGGDFCSEHIAVCVGN